METEDIKYDIINRKNLLKALESIGWGLTDCGHGFYHIKNQLGNDTQWRFRVEDESTEIHEISFEGQFGEQEESYIKGGSCVFILKGCNLTSRKTAVSISVKRTSDGKESAFLSFYNFNK